MFSDFRLNHIKREALWHKERQNNSFSKFCKRKGLDSPILKHVFVLMHQFCSKSILWMHLFGRKVFSKYTHCEENFSLDTPILKNSFLWMHSFWRIFFSWSTHFECTWENWKQSPKILQEEEEEEEHFLLLFRDKNRSERKTVALLLRGFFW